MKDATCTVEQSLRSFQMVGPSLYNLGLNSFLEMKMVQEKKRSFDQKHAGWFTMPGVVCAVSSVCLFIRLMLYF